MIFWFKYDVEKIMREQKNKQCDLDIRFPSHISSYRANIYFLNRIIMFYIWVLLLLSLAAWFLLFMWFFAHVFIQAIFGYGVPYVPTPDYKIQKLLKSITVKPGQRFLDIGCGDGRIVEAIKNQFPNSECEGIENSFYPYRLAKKRKRNSSVEFQLKRGDFYKLDLSQYDVIYCYLLPIHMKHVWKKIETDCKKGTLLYSSAFEIPNKKPKSKIHIEEEKYFYVYEV